MGLPLFVVPVEPEAAAKAAEKSASAPRSSIRRQRAMRGLNRISGQSGRRQGMHRDNLEELEDMLDPENGRLPSTPGLTNEPVRVQGRPSFYDHDHDRMRLRDTLSFERENLSTELDGTFMPPVPESRDHTVRRQQRDMMRLRAVRQDRRRMARRRPAPTPPYTESDLNRMARENSPDIQLNLESSTPNRSPLHQPSSGAAASTSNQSVEDEDSQRQHARGRLARTSAARITEMNTARMQELSRTRAQALASRVSNMQMQQSRRLLWQARMDGLGDRDRSLSPEGSAAWDTLLTSITPDPQPPSSGSSFASAAAAASSGTGGASASTSMTSLNEPEDLPALHDCDILSMDELNSDEEEEDIYDLETPPRGRPDRSRRTYANVATPHRSTRNGIDTEYPGMHRIISGLASRDEIPDDWWASAGLSRNLRREPAI